MTWRRLLTGGKMIIVNFRPNPRRRSNPANEPPYFAQGIEHWRLTVRPHLWRPSTDLYETEEKYTVRVEIAGMNEAEFSISVDQNYLTISGARPDPSGERRAYHQMEIAYGEFMIQIELPGNIDHDKIQADYQDGFLTITLPKAGPRQIRVGTE